MLANTAASLPLRRVGQPADMGEALYYLVSAPSHPDPHPHPNPDPDPNANANPNPNPNPNPNR